MKRVVIVGAGIAGPVLGMFLRRLDVEVVLCEARERAALGEGAFLGVAPNGLAVLAALGLAERVEALGHPCAGFRFANHAGREIGAIDRSRDRADFGHPLTMIRRAELHTLLAEEAARRGVTLRFGARLVGLAGERARFADGSEAEGELVVGADGLRSTVRRLAFPDAPAPHDSALLDCGGFARVDGLPFPAGVNEMVFGRRAFFGAFTTPDGETWWFHNGPATTGPGLRERLLALHAGDPPWIAALVRATPELLGPWPLHDLRGLRRWSRGRVCLIGDAAHAMSPSAGQGASLAMEDAMVLAQALRDVPDPAAAARVFEQRRRARVDAIARHARRQGANKAPGPVGGWLRDRLLPFFLRMGAAAQSRSYAYRIAWDGASR